MKPLRLLLPCILIALLAGCALFESPSAKRTRRNEEAARSAENRRSEYERESAINTRAAQYERQGMSTTEARAAAEREVPGLLPRR